MNIYINDSVSEYFVYNYLPRMITLLCVERLKKVDSKAIDNYLSTINEELTAQKLISLLKNNLKISKVGNKYIITIDNSKIEYNYNFASLIRLLDYGNTSVKGLNVVNKVFKFVQNNLRPIYTRYRFLERR